MNIPALFSEIELSRITVPPRRLRELRPQTVDVLAESIGRQGLLQPIRVQVTKDGYRLIAGWHRLEAVRKLGHATILAGVVKDIDADQAQLAEIDENLIRAELSPAERAAHVAARKAVYERLHPETKHGGDRKSESRSQNANLKSFVADTAKKTGKHHATVARDVKRGKDIPDVAALAGTSLDKGVELDALAKLSEDEQIELAERAKAGEKVTARNVFVDLEFQKTMVWVRTMSGLSSGLSSLTPSTTLTGREVRKARADIKRTIEQLHALDARLAAPKSIPFSASGGTLSEPKVLGHFGGGVLRLVSAPQARQRACSGRMRQ
jgi:ParB family transcriptional regulator, chromosome partitioning protein